MSCGKEPFENRQGRWDKKGQSKGSSGRFRRIHNINWLHGDEALDTAKALAKDRIEVAVLHVPTISPLDETTIIAEARRSGRMVVVAENHEVAGARRSSLQRLGACGCLRLRSARSPVPPDSWVPGPSVSSG